MKLGLSLTRPTQGSGGPRRPRVMRTSGYAIGLMGCSHTGVGMGGNREANLRTCLDWLQSHDDLVALVGLGDLNESPNFEPGWSAWLDDPEGGNLASSIMKLPVIGNHDTEAPWLGPYGSTPEDPHATIKSRYPALFQGREWYRWDHGALRFIALNNLTDYLSDEAESMYFNCNPPGSQYELNPDHSGITVADSAQRLFLAAAMTSAHPWKIAGCHRAVWAPFDSDPRKLHRSMRDALRGAIDAGLSLLAQADIHVTSFSGPWYPTPPANEEYRQPGQCGVYSLTLAGGYAAREVDPDVLPNPETTLHYASGSETGHLHRVSVALLRFIGDVADLQIFEADDGVPAGAVVFRTTLIRNPGA